MTQKLAYIVTGDAITVFLHGQNRLPFTMNRDHKLAPQLVEAIKKQAVEEVERIIDTANFVEAYAQGKVSIRDGEVYVGDELVHNVVAERILAMQAEGFSFDSMAKFLENLMLNPSFQSRQELYLFMENGNMPIMEDGRFIAYKWVRDNYRDCHTGRFDNSVGQILKMERRNVDDDRQQTCSHGFHVCTQNYTQFGQRLMLVAVNPKDVVSVPYDYNNAKMRVAEYEVIKEIPPEEYVGMNQLVYSDDPEDELDEEEDDFFS